LNYHVVRDIELNAPPYVSAHILSSVAILFSAAVSSPIDRWRILKQVNIDNSPGPRDIILRGYRGISSRMAGAFIYSGVHMASMTVVTPSQENNLPLTAFAAHSFAKLIATTTAYPFDANYTRRASGYAPATNGMAGRLFPGLSVAVAAAPISVGASLLAVSFLGLIFPLDVVSTDQDFARGVAVGTVGAVSGAVVTYPLDTVRRRVIAGQLTINQAVTAGRFFRGLPIFLLKAVPESALLTYSYLCNLRYFSFSVPS
jgi:hypothetical protein